LPTAPDPFLSHHKDILDPIDDTDLTDDDAQLEKELGDETLPDPPVEQGVSTPASRKSRKGKGKAPGN
jgi:hypothetical protein